MKFYKLWSEWDMGWEDLIFTSVENAKNYARHGYCLEFTADDDEDFDDIWDDLIGVIELEVVG